MKVIHSVVSLMPSYGGPARSVPELCRWLAEHVDSIEVFTTLENGDSEKPLSLDSVRTNFVECRNNKRLRLLWSPEYKKTLLKRIREIKPDILHDHGMWLQTNHVVVNAAHDHKIPSLISPRGMVEPWAMHHKAWKKKVAWKLYQHKDMQKASVLHATSPTEAQHLRALGLKQPIAVVPNGINLAETNSVNGNKENGERICLFVGRIYPVKGLLNLVEAWSKVRPEGWKVILAGPDESSHRVKVENRIRKHNLGEVFTLTGPVEGAEVVKLYKAADLVVLPSFSENFGMVVVEAMNYSVPVITTKGTPWQELQTHGCGWWVDVGVDPLAQAIREATSMSTGERNLMGRRGRNLVEEKYSWPSLADTMHDVYKWMIDGGPVPDCVIKN